jgi:hypothetical protein
MSDGSDRWQELDTLLDRVLDGIYNDEDLRRLNEILRADVEACHRYIHYVELHGRLAWGESVRATDGAAAAGAAVELPHQQKGQRGGERGFEECPSASSASLPIILQTSPELPTPYSPLGGFLFSYAVAAATVAIGLLVGWMYQISVSRQPMAPQSTRSPTPIPILRQPEMQFVGRITGTFDCQLADASTAVADHALVPLGSRYALASGLMEITYDRGAKVILQGPCVYRVESPVSGYLGLGKLTAKVEKRGEMREERGESREGSQQSMVANRGSPTPHSPLPTPLFTVRTPTAIVKDIGTEFAVEVDKSGASRAHVFLGSVEVRAGDDSGAKVMSLRANESARVDSSKGRAAVVVRESPRRRAFVREMPKMLPIALFNTGIGLKKGDPDPHWQVIGRSDDAKFRPRPAVAWGVRANIYLKDDRARSQWLSLEAGNVDFPEEVIFVFRTTFDLTGRLPSKAVLRCKFLADDRLVGIRLNGRRLPVPVHHDGMPFLEWASFQVSSGFVRGTNVLEFDVFNANPFQSPDFRRTAKSRMSFRAELEGTAASDPEFSGSEAGRAASRNATAKSKTLETRLKKGDGGT